MEINFAALDDEGTVRGLFNTEEDAFDFAHHVLESDMILPKELIPEEGQTAIIELNVQTQELTLKCKMCGTVLDQVGKKETENCGGDCALCMADSGDEDCLERLGYCIDEGCPHYGTVHKCKEKSE
jgi:hypothetical protein